MYQVLPATNREHIEAARELFREYALTLDFSLCFQNFEEELATLPGKYAPPRGLLLLAYIEAQPVGCIALRPLEDEVCEMKRLYVRPVARGHDLGRRLVDEIIAYARSQHYTAMRLDTHPRLMGRAIALYRELGFHEIAPYYDSPIAETLFLELTL